MTGWYLLAKTKPSSPTTPGLLIPAGVVWIRGTCGICVGFPRQPRKRQDWSGQCSLANKAFVLKAFFMSQQLDFLFVTESWQVGVGESSIFTEPLPTILPLCRYP
ncbi:hypothetical protein AMECASPLE_018087, partial [Ameca splendens]